MLQYFRQFIRHTEFFLPSILLAITAAGFFLQLSQLLLAALVIGLAKLVLESFYKIREGHFALDYVALLAMATSLALSEFLAGAIIGFMYAFGSALEDYGYAQAQKTLKALIDQIPKTCLIKGADEKVAPKNIQDVNDGEIILVRKNELIPLDGFLVSHEAVINEANLTGEIEPKAYGKNDFLKSGFINVGNTLEMKVVGDFAHSTYQRIVQIVEESKKQPANLVRLAERFNVIFTLITLVFAGGALLFFNDWTRVLAVLVIATPCPLLIAAPVSFLGGLNKGARREIIFKKPIIIELLRSVRTVFFDKTGTLTLGEPKLQKIIIHDSALDENIVIELASAIEFHSIHPLARSFIQERERRELRALIALNVDESIGKGISGEIDNKRYSLKKSSKLNAGGITIDFFSDDNHAATFIFDDALKDDAAELFSYFRDRGYYVAMLTGDKKENADRLFGRFNIPIYAECSPEEKSRIVREHQGRGQKVALVGDGLNDAPALAIADAGIVFSGTENSASIEAADVAILSHEAGRVSEAFEIARSSYGVALQSIVGGIGLSTIGMVLAFFGYIPPVTGAILQEVIDVVVIVNSLRSTY
ncbi:MAG: cadmium-translocating P-type ATPase [Candidatus Spechtbacteria bacterium]|nr:cadmium-translocating P-type ATPase [Candidatus Spechtbacteria bacterium]